MAGQDAASSFADNDNEKERGKEGVVSLERRGEGGNCFTLLGAHFHSAPHGKREEKRQF